MTQNEIIENNRLIAEFMGYEKEERTGKSPMYKHSLRVGAVPVSTCAANLEFHTSWDWLMPVVGKINSELRHGRPEIRIGFRTEVFYSPLTKDGETVQKLSNSYPDGTIESVYKAVVQFIKWHNINKG